MKHPFAVEMLASPHFLDFALKADAEPYQRKFSLTMTAASTSIIRPREEAGDTLI